MNAVSGIFVALTIVFGGGYVLNKMYVVVKVATVKRIQKRQPSLSRAYAYDLKAATVQQCHFA